VRTGLWPVIQAGHSKNDLLEIGWDPDRTFTKPDLAALDSPQTNVEGTLEVCDAPFKPDLPTG